MLELACKGQELNYSVAAIKDPGVLEFLDIPESYRMVESKLIILMLFSTYVVLDSMSI